VEHAPLPEPLPTVRPASPRARAQAVVIGAGMGGLATAAALRRHVDRVTIVERDDLPSIPAARSGVPQGRHLHALQPGGLAALDRLIPGFRSELVAAGAVSLTVPRDVLWMSAAGWMQPFPGRGRTMVSGSRELIELVARRMVLADPGITVRPGVEVAALAVESGRVVGVDVRPRGSAPSEPASDWVSGELVVDASGRRSSAPEWLAAAGYDRPAETVVDATLAYSTRIYRRTGDELVPGYRAVFLQARPPHTTRMAVMFPIEGDRWMLTLAGTSGDLPPTDEAGFLDFARGLRSPVVADAIERLDPVSPVAGYRRTANRRRHFEDLRRAPDGFVAVGDAACAFNPVYAQGMTAAALTAEAIERSLAGHRGRHAGALAGASTAMQKAVARANAGPWTIATGEDLRYPATTGGSSSVPERLIRRYMDRLVAAAATDPEVNAAFFDVIAVLAEPSTLLRPSMSLRVLGRRHPVPPADPPVPAPRRPTAAVG
jgi:2-polyprenyl-6-methoxyphenol hydroxylase-like FAD-dependent oxidoreductase